MDGEADRREHPSGWFYLMQHDAIPLLIDALLTLPPGHEFTVTEFADRAGVARESIEEHTDLLVEVEVIEEVPNTNPQRYHVSDSAVVRELYELNSALNNVGE